MKNPPKSSREWHHTIMIVTQDRSFYETRIASRDAMQIASDQLQHQMAEASRAIIPPNEGWPVFDGKDVVSLSCTSELRTVWTEDDL